jgi:general stress protein 26
MVAENLDAFWELIDGNHVCMMTTLDSKALRARPMNAIVDKATHEFRFLTRLSTHKADALSANPDVNLSFSDPGAGRYISVSGQAYLTQDRDLIEELWSAESASRLACGSDDPDIAVIRVVPSRAEEWDGRGAFRRSFGVFKPRHSELEPDLAHVRRRAAG